MSARPPGKQCPKCGKPRLPDNAGPLAQCPHCGIYFEKFLAGLTRGEKAQGPTADEQALAAYREGLRNPKPWHFLLAPVLLALGSLLGKLLLPVAAAGFAFARLTGRGFVSPRQMQREIGIAESELALPWLARLLSRFEILLAIMLACVLTPRIARWMLGSHTGEIGMGGMIFLLAALILSMIVTASWAAFQSGYVRDAYHWRLPQDFAATFWLGYLLIRYSGGS